ncbi:hypothetical protein GQ457_07G004140 [Hibiscus cannabinus]
MLQSRWGGDQLVTLSTTYMDSTSNPIRCGEFMMVHMVIWDIRRVRQVFSASDADMISQCPIAPTDSDVLI